MSFIWKYIEIGLTKMGIWETRENQIIRQITSKNIPPDEFKFRNDEFYPLKVFCQICGQKRFSSEEIEYLSDKQLTISQFMEKYKSKRHSIKGCCEKIECQQTLYILTQGYNCYDLLHSWDFLEIREAMKTQKLTPPS